MPTRRIQPLPLPYQVAQREVAPGQFRWFLQRQRPGDPATWEDIGGPYIQRSGAVIRYQRLTRRQEEQPEP